MTSTLIRDFVDVRPHPTVVRLEHLEGRDAPWISASYHITREVQNHLHALRHALRQETGCGVFLIGHYGSGKSHFLAYLTQQLRGGGFLDPAADVATVSLLNFRAGMALEDIVSEALGLESHPGDRRTAWTRLAARHPNGLLLVLDELSEFLRSKSSPAAFNEDVRFLQYMGEWAQGQRFWIVAAMQEQIEHTGDLEYALYRKIKDRYPLRLLLSPAHVRDLIGDSILIRKPGYEAAVAELAGRLREVYPAIDGAELCAIYPLHPATLELLEEVRDRFSQARGIVEFTVTWLAGNPARNIAPFLDRPWGSLITPDVIVDHFQDLFEIQPEFLPLAQQLLPYYRKHLAGLFDSDAQRDLAWRLLKLLVLVSLSPVRDGLSAEEAAYWLLFAAARIDPGKNLRIVERVLKQLVEQGRYIAVRDGRYRIDLADEGAERLEKLVERELAELPAGEDVVFDTLTGLLPSQGFNPFLLPREQWQARRIRWHFHERAFAVYLGNDTPAPPQEPLALCIRLPWGEPARVQGAYVLQPARLGLSPELRELAALSRAAARPLGPDLAARIKQRIAERLPLLQDRIRHVYQEATLTSPAGDREPAPRMESPATLDEWLNRHGEWLCKRLYPGFERHAPSHGPLPKEAYRRLMRHVSQHDLGDEEADEYVKLIREAYLAPMGLLRRKGREYVTPPGIEKNELVSLVLPLLAHQPAPKAVYEHLASPIYGLVPDQVHLLLIFLLIQGEVDILKGRQSYREAYETLPTPLQYDRIVPGHALNLEQLKDLQRLCEGLNIRIPKQWSVLAQRHAVRQLREAGQRHTAQLQPLLFKLGELGQGEELAGQVRRLLAQWAALDKGDHELQGLQHFLYEIGSPARFLAAVNELSDLPGRIDRLLGELQRLRHLLNHPLLAQCRDPALTVRLEALGAPPGLDAPDAVEHWLRQARSAYEDYKSDYRRRHDAWWQEQNNHPLWTWQPPALSASRHLGLDDALRQIKTCQQHAQSLCCRGLSNLDFQPQCICGFDGERAPLADELARFDTLRTAIDSALTLFFQQEDIKTRLRDWQNQGLEMNTQTLNYLEGRQSVPEVKDIALLDQHLAGLELVKPVAAESLAELLGGRTWERAALLAAIDQWLNRQNATRLRFTVREDSGRDTLTLWCAEQALRHAASLPAGLTAREQQTIVEGLRAEWVSPTTLARLEDLGFSDAAVDRILGWLLDGQLLAPSTNQASPLVAAARELIQPSRPDSASLLAATAANLYAAHHRLLRLAPKPWLARLEELALTTLPDAPPDLMTVLKNHGGAQWLVIDCLGLPLLAATENAIPELFPGWRLQERRFAQVSPRTTTGAFYQQLLDEGHARSLEKIDAVDTLLHERFLPFDDLAHLAVAELRAACKAMRRRLDPGQPLLIFADHGFRLAPDGKSYRHGGASTLERVVPVWCLAVA